MLDRTVQPAFQKSSSFDLIQPEEFLLPNSVPVTVVRGGEQAVAKIELIFQAGKWHELQPGVAYFTTQLLQKGTASKNSFQISSETEQRGIHVDVAPGNDFTSLALYGLTRNLHEVLDLTAEIISVPSFPQHELDQTRAIYTQSLKINLEKTSYLASQQLRKNLFGDHHPYGHDADISDINKLERSWLADFHQKNFSDFSILCSGNVTDDLLNRISSVLGSLNPTSVVNDNRAIHDTPGQKHDVIDKPESVQSSLRLGSRTINRTHADYPALLLLNHIFGGYFGSRLMKNIREEKGLTYGIYSSVNALKYGAYLSVGTDVNKENRTLALDEIRNEMHTLCREAVTHSELEIARNHFIGSLQSEITTPFAHADKIKNLQLFSLPRQYYQNLITTLDSLTEQDLLGTANQYLNPEEFISVTAG